MLENASLIQLRSFAAVARRRSFTQAAADLDYTPPAVHQQLRALERILGFPLVRRHVSPLALTPEAEALLPHVESLLYQVGEISQVVRNLLTQQRVVLGTAENTGISIVMPMLSEWADETPEEIDVQVHEASTLADLVREGAVDIALSARFARYIAPPRRGDLRLVRWTTDQLVLVERNGRNSTARGPIFVPPYVNADPYPPCVGPAHRDRRMVPMMTGDAAKSAALAGLGLAIMPISAVWGDIAAARLRALPGEVRPYHVYLLHRAPATMNASTRNVLRFLLTHRPRIALPPRPSSSASAARI
jgi:DNA-binding transcriptional LysR family regulator